MPTAEEILSLLHRASNELTLVAVIFHVLVFVFTIGLIRGWRPTQRLAGILLSIAVLSVSVIAWMYGNPFNAIFFLVGFVLLLVFALNLPLEKVEIVKGPWLFLSILFIVSGWFYPHFLDERPWMYLIGAPMGVIPCPTLLLVTGFTLLFQYLNSKKWALTLVVIGLFYGLFGVLRLHVYIDVVLVLGALLLLMRVFFSHRATEPTKRSL